MRTMIALLALLLLSTTANAYPTPEPNQQVYDLANCFGNEQARATRLNEQLNRFAQSNEGTRILVLCIQRPENETLEVYARTFLGTIPSQNFIAILILARELDSIGRSSAIVMNAGAAARLDDQNRTRILQTVRAQKTRNDYPHALEYGTDALVNIFMAPEPTQAEGTPVGSGTLEPVRDSTRVAQAHPATLRPPQDDGAPTGLIVLGIIIVLVLIVLSLIYFPEYNLIMSLLELLMELLSALASSKD